MSSYIRFTCKQPSTSYYTASFSILDMASISAAGQNVSGNLTSATSHALSTPYLTLVLPNSTVVSALPARPTSAKATPTASRSAVSAEDEQSYLDSHTPKSAKSVSNSITHRIDFERLKFRIVFIFWPALVGITMAL